MSIFEFDDQQGVRTRGTLRAPGATPGDVLTVGTSRGAVSPSPGGGSQPVQATYSGNFVTINNGDTESLTWDVLGSGDDLLDRTDPATPLVIASGFYAISLDILANADLSVGGKFAAQINGAPNIGAVGQSTFSNNPALTMIQKFTAGDALTVTVANFDGTQTIGFSIGEACVVKLA